MPRVAIVGLGGMGSAAAFHLARAGVEVIGLERWHAGHDRSGSAGSLRGFRMAYFQNPAYVALAKRAEALWRTLDGGTGALFKQTGGALIGAAGHPVIRGVQASSAVHDLGVERVSPEQALERLPGLPARLDEVVLWAPRAGVLDPKACDHAHREGARAAGARLVENTALEGLVVCKSGFRIQTDQEEFSADWVIVSPGVWMGDSALGISLPSLCVTRQIQGDFVADERWTRGLWNLAPAGVRHAFYGNGRGEGELTVGQYLGGAPGLSERPPDTEEMGRIQDFVDARLHGLGPALRWRVGHSIDTPDRAPLIGAHPEHSRVLIAGGFSGHGYKFASAVGWHLAQWVQGSRHSAALHPFRPQRLPFELKASA